MNRLSWSTSILNLGKPVSGILGRFFWFCFAVVGWPPLILENLKPLALEFKDMVFDVVLQMGVAVADGWFEPCILSVRLLV